MTTQISLNQNCLSAHAAHSKSLLKTHSVFSVHLLEPQMSGQDFIILLSNSVQYSWVKVVC